MLEKHSELLNNGTKMHYMRFLKLAETNYMIFLFLEAYIRGLVSWCEMLEYMAIALERYNQTLNRMLREQIQGSVQP